MFNLLVSGDGNAWESGQRMGMPFERFLESGNGDESEGISVAAPTSLKRLEHIPSLLMYEKCVQAPDGDSVRVGQMHGIRPQEGRVTFRFTELGRIPRSVVFDAGDRLQFQPWEANRTRWAVKDGDIPQDVLRQMVPSPRFYDVVFSFAGEDRQYVERVAEYLKERGVAVFYDEYERATLWGKDLVEHFESVYRRQGRYCVMFISRHYAEKVWPRHERRSALARALEERTEYVLPVRFDDSEVPGLRPTTGYVDLAGVSPGKLGELILQKLGRR